jgi:ubiquinone/menaquinone biosynthesis C-methylase UbiE
MSWFNSVSGSHLLDIEKKVIVKALEEKFGYFAVQLDFSEFDFLSTSRITLRLSNEGKFENIKFLNDALPFDKDSIDLILCPHTLEKVSDYRSFLEGCYRAIIPNGYLVIMSFNPYSFAGLRSVLGFENVFPWNTNFVSLNRCQLMLKEVGFSIDEAKLFNYQPLFNDQKVSFISSFESVGDRWLPFFGNIYCIVAKKDVPGMTPLKPKWKTTKKARVVTDKT